MAVLRSKCLPASHTQTTVDSWIGIVYGFPPRSPMAARRLFRDLSVRCSHRLSITYKLLRSFTPIPTFFVFMHLRTA
jgi:hypothetical protein